MREDSKRVYLISIWQRNNAGEKRIESLSNVDHWQGRAPFQKSRQVQVTNGRMSKGGSDKSSPVGSTPEIWGKIEDYGSMIDKDRWLFEKKQLELLENFV